MRPAELRPDCANCAALCCVGLAFAESGEFAFAKPAGRPCRNLLADCRCTIHDLLRERGFRGCVAYDCFGAGQRIVQDTFRGRHWREPDVAPRMFAAYRTMRALHEILWYLTEALTLPAARPVYAGLRRALAETEHLAGRPAGELERLDADAHRAAVNPLLVSASELVRAGVSRPDVELRRADLIAAALPGADLRGANLRGALLIRADLRGADLNLADLTGADCRDADLRGADLGTAIFLTQPQIELATGDAGTVLPQALNRPAHWAA
ncbi:MAG TPA: pentapeptide repeat-containing protein [Actinophytocola sp.]|uniref:pentapeptide repeat-containing protein n=1 Tax=Actinophytocola sp. TaxID=1872138 RepID=UPI002DBC7B3F|nr:pentapeptide repeat-containing protein [Actinophytocola sp.]HEU5474444.1 pentapeptide repeat-containing protein [Actinophytocola sp.]